MNEHTYIQVLDDVCFWDDNENLVWEVKKGTSLIAIVSTEGNRQTAHITNPHHANAVQTDELQIAQRHQTLDNQNEFRVLRTVPGFFHFETLYTPEEYTKAFRKEAKLLAQRINTYNQDPIDVFADFLREHGQVIENRRAA